MIDSESNRIRVDSVLGRIRDNSSSQLFFEYIGLSKPQEAGGSNPKGKITFLRCELDVFIFQYFVLM
jgi:hypothetical protein